MKSVDERRLKIKINREREMKTNYDEEEGRELVAEVKMLG